MIYCKHHKVLSIFKGSKKQLILYPLNLEENDAVGLVGTLGFFDMRVYTPISFVNIGELLQIKPRGGGGTDFNCIFNYIRKNLTNDPPVDIVIFTDGQADFPNEAVANNIPVLWLFSDRSVVPPWGKYAYVDDVK